MAAALATALVAVLAPTLGAASVGASVAVSSAAFRSAAGRCNFPVMRNESKPKVCGTPSEAVREGRRCAEHHQRLLAAGGGV